jgi:glycosyltransferase involved in cell wall biosynthesis
MLNDPDIDISLVIPARNEAGYLPDLLETVDVARAHYLGGRDSIEVIVVDNDSSDETADIARAGGCQVTLVTRRCIAAARNGGAAVARGRIVSFADADFSLHPETFNTIFEIMTRPGFIGGGTGLAMERWSLGIRTTFYMILPPLWLLGVDGGVWFCRLADFRESGGFDENVRAGEDVRFLLKLKKMGRQRKPRESLVNRFTFNRLSMPRAFAIASCRKFDKRGDWHMFSDILRGLFLLVLGWQKVDDFIQEYWYEDESWK